MFNYSSILQAKESAESHHLRQQADSRKWKVNVSNDFWTGSLFVGSTQKQMNVIFDTSSDWLALQGKECNECKGNKFD